MASSFPKSFKHRKLALIISNGNYSRSENKLTYSINNGNDLRNALQSIGFIVQFGSDLNKHQINTQIIDFSKTINEGDLVLVYFTGHCYQVNGENYFIPIEDNQIENDTDIEDFSIHIQRTLKRIMAQNSSYVSIMILDCYTSYSLKNTKVSNSSTKGQGLCQINPPVGAFIQFSCNINQTNNDSRNTDRHSLFTKHFLRRITQENVHIVDFFEQIKNEVFEESGRNQQPFSMNGLSEHKQVFLNEVIAPPPEAPREWEDIKTKDLKPLLKKQEELRSYYDQFPDIDEVANRDRPDIRQAESLTESILSQIPSGDPNERDTTCHLLNRLLGEGNNHCLFFDSKQGTNLHDASKNLVDLHFKERPFVLKLNNSDGLGKNQYLTGEKHDLKIIHTLSETIEQNQSHPFLDDIIERLAKAHQTEKKNILLQNVYSGSFNFVYTVKDLTNNLIDKFRHLYRKLREQFKQFVAAKIHPLLYRPSFDISQFDTRGNKDFMGVGSSFEIGPPGKTKTYTQPSNWTRFGLKVLGVYSSDTWLKPFQHPANWYRAYHGTGRAQADDFGTPDAAIEKQYAPVDAVACIYQKGFRPARVTAYGAGVYCSPDPIFPENGYVAEVPLDTKQGRKIFKCMLQVAVNPDGVNCASKDIWVVASPENIRPYGILIKEVQ